MVPLCLVLHLLSDEAFGSFFMPWRGGNEGLRVLCAGRTEGELSAPPGNQLRVSKRFHRSAHGRPLLLQRACKRCHRVHRAVMQGNKDPLLELGLWRRSVVDQPDWRVHPWTVE